MGIKRTPCHARVVDEYPRQTFLIAYGALYIAIGLGWFTGYSPSHEAGIAWLPPFFNNEALGVLWLVGGVVAIIGGIFGLNHLSGERLGFFLLQLAPLLIAFYFFMSNIIFIVPPPIDGGSSNGSLYGTVYLAIYAGAFFMARAKAPQDTAKLVEANRLMTGAIQIQHAKERE